MFENAKLGINTITELNVFLMLPLYYGMLIQQVRYFKKLYSIRNMHNCLKQIDLAREFKFALASSFICL